MMWSRRQPVTVFKARFGLFGPRKVAAPFEPRCRPVASAIGAATCPDPGLTRNLEIAHTARSAPSQSFLPNRALRHVVGRAQVAVSRIPRAIAASVAARRSLGLNWMNSVPASAAGACPGGI